MGFYCNECKDDIPKVVYDWSKDNLGRPLCRSCQKDEKSKSKRPAKKEKKSFLCSIADAILGDERVCDKCDKDITESEFDYSSIKFNRPLCRNCQPKKSSKPSAPKPKYQPPKPEPKSKPAYSTPSSSDDYRNKYPTKYLCRDGHKVRSRAEVIIDNWLDYNGVRHSYEKQVFSSSGKPIALCDWYLPEGDVYLEFWGLNETKYLKRKQDKINAYERNNLKLIQLENKEIDRPDDLIYPKIRKYINFKLK